MKFKEAQKIIKEGSRKGYMVVFKRYVGRESLVEDFFPEINEELIPTEEEAWRLAKDFASKTFDYCVGIYVADANFTPVKDFKIKMISNTKV